MHLVETENGIWRAGVQQVLYRADEAASSECFEQFALGIYPDIGVWTRYVVPYLSNGVLFIGIGVQNPLFGPAHGPFHVEAVPTMRNPEINRPVRFGKVRMNLDIAAEMAQHGKDLQFKIRAHKLGKLFRLKALAQFPGMIFRVLSKPILNPLPNLNCLQSASTLQELECCLAIHYCPSRLRYCLEK